MDPAARERLRERVFGACRALGFARSGVAPARPTQHEQELRAWLDAGKHGSMAWMEQLLEHRLDPRVMLPGARSVVMVADVYASHKEPTPPAPAGGGLIARYARGRDYHAVVKKRLHELCDRLRLEFPGDSFRAFVDTAPVLEREHAARAGLGFVGKHTLVIVPGVGSYVVLGGIATTLDLSDENTTTTSPRSERERRDAKGGARNRGMGGWGRGSGGGVYGCGTCTACIDACPTGAITPFEVDARRCVSYLTIEHAGEIDARYHEGIGLWIFGCDICQEVCPYVERGSAPVHRAYRSERDSFDLLGVLGWSEADRSRELSGTAMKRATLAMWKRNALIVAGNTLRDSDDDALRTRVEQIARDPGEDPVVRETARTVLRRLGA